MSYQIRNSYNIRDVDALIGRGENGSRLSALNPDTDPNNICIHRTAPGYESDTTKGTDIRIYPEQNEVVNKSAISILLYAPSNCLFSFVGPSIRSPHSPNMNIILFFLFES